MDRSTEVISGNFFLWARPLIQVLVGSSRAGGEVSHEPEAKIAVSSK